MTYSVEMGSGAMIFISRFIKIGSGIRWLLGCIPMQAHRTHTDRKVLSEA
jgi:hypothetical protein